MRLLFDQQRTAFAATPYASALLRRERLSQLMALLHDHEEKIIAALVKLLLADEMAKIRAAVGDAAFEATYVRAAQVFENMSMRQNFTEFSTLPLYEALG